MKKDLKYKIFILVAFLSFSSCFDFVEDGIEVEYADSAAQLNVSPLGNQSGATNETVSFAINVRSDFNLKSCIIKANVEGKNGSGFNVSDENFDDPFADHNFGTIKPGIKSFNVRYDYIIPEGTNRSRITITTVDESGKATAEQVVEVVPAVVSHDGIVAYAKNATFHDAISSVDGVVHNDIKSNFSMLSAESVDVQEKIDIIFYYSESSKRAVIASPAAGSVDLELSIENATLFRKLTLPEFTSLEDMSASDLDRITADANLSEDGSSQISGVKVGDFIGFIADLNAVNSLKKGILKVEGLHPGSVPRYDGISYVLKCSLIVQK